MLCNQTEEQRQEMTAQDDGVLGVSFAFDWKAGHYEMAAGSPVEISGTRAAQAWLQQVLRTKRERYSIYPTDLARRPRPWSGKSIPRAFSCQSCGGSWQRARLTARPSKTWAT